MAHKHIEDYEPIKIKLDNFLANTTNRPFAVGGTIRIPSDWIGFSTGWEYKARMVHEAIHIEQQKYSLFYGFFVYVPKWLMNNKFRAICEMPAFWAQMECYRDCAGITTDHEKMKRVLVDKYRGAFTENLAEEFLKAFEMKRSIKDWEKFYEENLNGQAKV